MGSTALLMDYIFYGASKRKYYHSWAMSFEGRDTWQVFRQDISVKLMTCRSEQNLEKTVLHSVLFHTTYGVGIIPFCIRITRIIKLNWSTTEQRSEKKFVTALLSVFRSDRADEMYKKIKRNCPDMWSQYK